MRRYAIAGLVAVAIMASATVAWADTPWWFELIHERPLIASPERPNLAKSECPYISSQDRPNLSGQAQQGAAWAVWGLGAVWSNQ